MQLTSFDGSWFALQIKARHERATALMLRHKGYEEFLPLCKVKRRWSDRIKEIQVPLFPGYLFCQFNPHVGAPIITTPGVIRIVGVGKTPVAVSDEEISAVQRLVKSGLNTQPWPYLRVGQTVRIESGPLEDLEGIVLVIKNHHRLIVSVSLLQRSVAVEIDRDWVNPIGFSSNSGDQPSLQQSVTELSRRY
jgi:transcription antitermination factor NusG